MIISDSENLHLNNPKFEIEFESKIAALLAGAADYVLVKESSWSSGFYQFGASDETIEFNSNKQLLISITNYVNLWLNWRLVWDGEKLEYFRDNVSIGYIIDADLLSENSNLIYLGKNQIYGGTCKNYR